MEGAGPLWVSVWGPRKLQGLSTLLSVRHGFWYFLIPNFTAKVTVNLHGPWHLGFRGHVEGSSGSSCVPVGLRGLLTCCLHASVPLGGRC